MNDLTVILILTGIAFILYILYIDDYNGRRYRPVYKSPVTNRGKKPMSLSKRIEMAAKKLIERKNEIEYEYYNYIDMFEQVAGEEGFKLKKDFALTDFSVFRDWHSGLISSGEAYRIMTETIQDYNQVAYNKLIKKIDQTLAEINEDPRYANTTNCLEEVKREIRANVKPLYVKYLNLGKLYLRNAKEIDKDQMTITHGVFQNKHRRSVREVTLNQAIKYIRANGLNHICDHKFVTNEHVVAFEVNESSRNHKIVEWFLVPSPYRELLCDIFDIREFTENSNMTQDEWLKMVIEGIEKSEAS